MTMMIPCLLPLNMKIFVGFHSTWSFIKWLHEWLENQGGRRCGEVMSALLAFFKSLEIRGRELVA